MSVPPPSQIAKTGRRPSPTRLNAARSAVALKPYTVSPERVFLFAP